MNRGCRFAPITSLKGGLHISYAIIRNENHKVNAVPLLERHNERRNKNYSNKDIDLSRSHLNYHLKQIQAESYLKEFDRIRTGQNLKGNLRLHGEKQSTVLCEFIITSDNEFFDRLGADKIKRFFEHAYDFVTAKVGGEQYVVSAVVHMDEATPHMHISFIPVIQGKDRKGQPCKRINCSEFWKGRDSYSRLQDEYFDYMANTCGYALERGQKGSTAEHLSVEEYKLKKTEKQLSKATKQLSEIGNIEKVSVKNLPLNTIALKKSDYETLATAAKGYVTAKAAEEENISLKAKCLSLQNENESLKKENDTISGQLHELDYHYSQYYAETANERELLSENQKLKSENDNISNQIHTLSAEILTLKSENSNLKTEVEEVNSIVGEMNLKIQQLNTELTEKNTLLQTLQKKFDRVMEFLKLKNLKEEWEKILSYGVRHKSR
ncbi:MAG: MobV family relaxase [Oscillospiraceae bacterium]|nr:MobV family relaxase [Oscillospiraceae bacterium]